MTDTHDTTGRMPALYIGHGAPPLLDDPVWSQELRTWAADLPRPRAILTVSRPLGGRAAQPVGHGRRHAAGLRLRRLPGALLPLGVRDAGRRRARAVSSPRSCPTPSRCTSTRAAASTTAPGCRSRSCIPRPTSRSCSSRCPPTTRAACSTSVARLQPLRDEGVLIVGSGFLTHGLPFLREFRIEAAPPGWSVDFDLWAAEALAAGDVDTLADFRSAPGHAVRAPHGRAPLAAVRHAGRRHRSVGAARRDDRRLLDGPVQALRPGRLTSYAVSAPAAGMREAPPHLCAAGPRGFRGIDERSGSGWVRRRRPHAER